jgi:predicted Zn-dependent protease
MGMIENFEKMLAGGKDSPLLRFSLGNEYMKAEDTAKASEHLRAAVALDAGYSAAWKLLGKALAQQHDVAGAIEAYQHGIAAAEAKGDKQAAKEMAVFLKRLQMPPKLND